MDCLRAVVFPGGFNWPSWVALKLGIFRSLSLDVSLHTTASSLSQMEALQKGEFELAFTGFDNVLAYSSIHEALPTDPIAVLGGDSGFLSLASQANFSDVSSLKGARIAVDALTTGYAFVLFEILESGGLSKDDVTIESVGGVAQRFESLIREEQDATLLVTPFDLMAEQNGLQILQRAREVTGSYQGVVAAVTRGWAADNADALIRFIQGYRQALDWLFNPANRSEALAIFRENMAAMPEALVDRTATELLASPGGFQPDARLDYKGAERVIQLRRKYTEKDLAQIEHYIDERYWHEGATQA
ncbi:ABC transporter substrate-binding protein [Pseudomonas yamanorum]|uniref:ABC transporter substrate-binding protein n=1 Tax=Pseudomonas yamanorum TaxID=515393 RepID=A0A7Y8FEF6_9PSED|nr:ABC transporter substrate-binding protein [Pseudomonas yamanorum]NWE77780.1 ABC transporter substrate-binding protein [Pseudomonas yamanorum]